MATVAQPTTTRKAPKSFYCTLYEDNGILGKVDGQIYFFNPDTGAVMEYEPEMAPWTCILGEVGLAETARICDAIRGGAAQIATTREMGRN